MNTTLIPISTLFHEKKLLEEFFTDYPTDKAEHLLLRWLRAGLENDFSKVAQEDLQEFSAFFERLHLLEKQCMTVQKSDGGES